MSIKILLVDSRTISREGIRTMLNGRPEMNVVGETESLGPIPDLVAKLSLDVVVICVSSSVLECIESLRKIKSGTDNVNVIVLTAHADEHTVKSMIRAGASGFLDKDCAFDELVTAIHSVVVGHSYFSPEATDFLLTGYLSKLSNKAS